MFLPIQSFTAAHRYVLDAAARAAGMVDPVALFAGPYYWALLKKARKGAAVPVDGVLIRDWSPANRRDNPGLRLGVRLYEIGGVAFACAQFNFDLNTEDSALNFLAVERGDYRRFYRLAREALRENEPASAPPVLGQELADNLWNNTIGYLETDRLARIRAFGGRARRGVLLTGPPGNGKTMACRWIWEECRRRNWEYRIVTPSTYEQARHSCNAEESIRNLFSVSRRGVIFFDDMDLALRDRDSTRETDDQAIFLTAIDGIQIKEGVVHVFATNCDLGLIDRAFKRPGRIDVALQFQAPQADLRRRLMNRWHPELLAHLHLDDAIASTAGFSFAEIEELRNLLVMHSVDSGNWSWSFAMEQFAENREDLREQIRRAVGFSSPALTA